MNIVVIYVCVFIVIAYIYIHYGLYTDTKYTTLIQLFVASNVLFGAYTLYLNASNDYENIQNRNIEIYTKLMESSFTAILDEFKTKPHMKYLFDEMYNNIPIKPHQKRDIFQEQIMVYRIMINISNYCVYYFSHKDIKGYDVLLKSQNKKVIEYFKKFNRSKIFHTLVLKYLQDFAGERTQYFFYTFIL